MLHNELIGKITELLKGANAEDLELILTFIETYLRKKRNNSPEEGG